jgi:hypothetical protein
VLWRRSKLGLHVPPGTADRLAAYLAGPGIDFGRGGRPV